MRTRIIIALILLTSLTTITLKPRIIISKFNIKEIIIENNVLLSEKDIKRSLSSIYDKNLLFLKNKEIEEKIIQNSFIDSFNIKKKYPNTLKIKIFEKKPIAILFNQKINFYLCQKIDFFDFYELQNYKNLPYVFGNKDDFSIFYKNLKKINFPFIMIKKYTFYKTNRWDLETMDNKVIKLPVTNYTSSLKNYLNLKEKKEFKNYKVFDYRIRNQLILK